MDHMVRNVNFAKMPSKKVYQKVLRKKEKCLYGLWSISITSKLTRKVGNKYCHCNSHMVAKTIFTLRFWSRQSVKLQS